jgi:hypothetical protein
LGLSADCIGYPFGELAPVLAELIRVVRPGGSIIILAWSSQQLLPGHPLLEARLNATCSAYIPYLEGVAPELNFLRAAHSFRKAGLEVVQAQTFVDDVQAPLSAGQRLALISMFNMLWGQPQPRVSPDDWQAYQRLCTPHPAEFILDTSDYYAFFTYSLFRGKVPCCEAGMQALVNTFNRQRLPPAKTWTTDAPYRETADRIAPQKSRRLADGRDESTGMLAVAQIAAVLGRSCMAVMA